MKQTKTTLKAYFETGDKPTEKQFMDLIDSMVTDGEVTDILSREVGEILKGHVENEFTYDDLNSLVAQEKLTIGQKYILSGYQTKYYIEGTNTSSIAKQITNNGVVSGYGFFDPPLMDLSNNVMVEVVSLPSEYTGPIKVGDTTAVVNYYMGYYLKFANGLHYVMGSVFKYQIPRYVSIVPDATVIDANSKIMMKPDGVINTDVHNGTPYMQMSAEENKVVPEEKIVLTAISKNKFSTLAESLTYPGELLEYDFTDTDIKNEENKKIGNRMGLITRRISADKKIDIDKDWRVQRYRRYKLSDEDWQNFILNNPGNHTVYNMEGTNAFTVANIQTTESHRYLLPYVEMKNFFQDFSDSGSLENIFLTGVTNPGSIVYGGMMESNNDDVFKKSVRASTVNNGKDFFIFPMDNYSKVESVVVKNLENTIFLNNTSQFSQNNVIEVKITDSISESTFSAGGHIFSSSVYGASGLSKITAIDNLQLRNKGKIENLCVLTTGMLNNGGEITHLTIGGMPSNATGFGVTYIDVSVDELSRLRNTMIGGKRVDRLFFNNVQTNKCLFSFKRGQYLKISDSITFLTAVKFAADFYTNLLSLDTTVINAQKNAYGYLYDSATGLSGQNIFKNNRGDLLYKVIDGANNNNIELITLAISK